MTDVVGGAAEGYGGAVSDNPVASAMALRTLQSGLPLFLEGGRPVAPKTTASRSSQLAIKRAIDLMLCLVALAGLAPLLVVVALAVKVTSAGPVFYRQARPGLNGVPFQLLKFRSMHADRCDDGQLQATSDDERVTWVGRIIRATSIDELPQLWNVLVGEMSLVGPRPMVEGQKAAGQDYRELVPYYDFRLRMKPGLTGWAQAHGLRGPTDDAVRAIRRIEHDCAYIQNFSLGLDIRTILKTLRGEFLTGSGI